MIDGTTFTFIGVLFLVVGLSVFFLLAWKFGPRSVVEEDQTTSDEIHVTA
jgi:hypothetical protein